MNLFNKDYYEDGIKKGISGYENYHWIPTRSYSEAIDIIKRFKFTSVIDYGCAKGFLVHALRQLGKEAYGEDISDYAIAKCMQDVKNYISKPTLNTSDLLICKDVMEHINENDVDSVLATLFKKSNKFLFVIPLGDDDALRIREYEIDKTHVTKKDEDWWLNKFKTAGFKIEEFSYSMGKIKEKWTNTYPFGNGFFVLNGNGNNK